MKSQPQNPEFRIYLENFHPCVKVRVCRNEFAFNLGKEL